MLAPAVFALVFLLQKVEVSLKDLLNVSVSVLNQLHQNGKAVNIELLGEVLVADDVFAEIESVLLDERLLLNLVLVLALVLLSSVSGGAIRAG